MDDLEKARQLFFAALSHHRQGDLANAVRNYEDALVLAPERPSIMSNLAAVYVQLGRYADAKSLCERCLEIDPRDTGALVHLGICLTRMNAPAAALQHFERALAIDPGETAAMVNRATALLALDAPDDALDSVEKALAVHPEHPEALNVRGNVLLKLGRSEDALASYERAAASDPDHTEAIMNRANALLRWGRDDEANEVYRQALLRRPADVRLRVMFGDVLRLQHRAAGAIEQYERALAIDGACVQAEYGLGCVRLAAQDYARGWPGYERRFATDEFRTRSFRKQIDSVTTFDRRSRWQGPQAAASSEPVAVWAEQGIGDEILFSTLIPDLLATGVQCVYELDARLIDIYTRAFPGMRFVARRDPPHDELLQCDSVVGCGSLPGFFRRSIDDFARQPARLLTAHPERVADYRRRLDAMSSGRKVAIAWRSAREDWWSRKKNTSLNAFVPLLKTPGMQFVDVQFGDTDAERSAAEASANVPIARFQGIDYFNDLNELFALLEACDLVITTSNATAHFAGALGKSTWVLYLADQTPFHYWAHRGDYRCAWYPAVRSVTAPHLTNWRALIGYAAEKLARGG